MVVSCINYSAGAKTFTATCERSQLTEGVSFLILRLGSRCFTRNDARSLAEALMSAQQGGAVAVWASSGMTIPDVTGAHQSTVISIVVCEWGRGWQHDIADDWRGNATSEVGGW